MQSEAYRDCEQCRGAGSVAYPCHRCKRCGRRRAQLVLSVANLDTGAVASHSVVPGGLDPEPTPTGWVVRLRDRVRELAASVGATVTDEVPELWLPSQWRPDLPALHRVELEAQAIVGLDNAPWRLFLGRSPTCAAGRPGRPAGAALRVGRPAPARPGDRGTPARAGLDGPVRGARLAGAEERDRAARPARSAGRHRRGRRARRARRARPGRRRPAGAARPAAPTRRAGRRRGPARTPDPRRLRRPGRRRRAARRAGALAGRPLVAHQPARRRTGRGPGRAAHRPGGAPGAGAVASRLHPARPVLARCGDRLAALPGLRARQPAAQLRLPPRWPYRRCRLPALPRCRPAALGAGLPQLRRHPPALRRGGDHADRPAAPGGAPGLARRHVGGGHARRHAARRQAGGPAARPLPARGLGAHPRGTAGGSRRGRRRARGRAGPARRVRHAALGRGRPGGRAGARRRPGPARGPADRDGGTPRRPAPDRADPARARPGPGVGGQRLRPAAARR